MVHHIRRDIGFEKDKKKKESGGGGGVLSALRCAVLCSNLGAPWSNSRGKGEIPACGEMSSHPLLLLCPLYHPLSFHFSWVPDPSTFACGPLLPPAADALSIIERRTKTSYAFIFPSTDPPTDRQQADSSIQHNSLLYIDVLHPDPPTPFSFSSNFFSNRFNHFQ